jgi:hypothetical protein
MTWLARKACSLERPVALMDWLPLDMAPLDRSLDRSCCDAPSLEEG